MLDQISLSGLICPFCPRVTFCGNCTIAPCPVWSDLVKGATPTSRGCVPVHNFLCKKAAQNSEGNDPFCIAPDSPGWWALEHGLSVQVPVAQVQSQSQARPGAHILSPTRLGRRRVTECVHLSWMAFIRLPKKCWQCDCATLSSVIKGDKRLKSSNFVTMSVVWKVRTPLARPGCLACEPVGAEHWEQADVLSRNRNRNLQTSPEHPLLTSGVTTHDVEPPVTLGQWEECSVHREAGISEQNWVRTPISSLVLQYC